MNHSSLIFLANVAIALVLGLAERSLAAEEATPPKPPIVRINPPEKDFFSKVLDFHGVLSALRWNN